MVEIQRLIIEPTTRCNLRCQMCLREVLGEPQGDMEPDIFYRLLPVFPFLEAVDFTGYGEPLLHPGLLDMVRLARQHMSAKGKISFITNGSLLSPELSRELVATGLDELGISLEGALTETHEGLRQGGSFQDALNGLSMMVEAKKRLGQKRPRLVIHMIAMRRNLSELPGLVHLAHQMGADGQVVSHLLPFTEDMKNEVVYSYHSAEALEYFKQLQNEAQEKNIDITPVLEYLPYLSSLGGLPPLRNTSELGTGWLTYVPTTHRPAIEMAAKFIVQASKEKVAWSLAKLIRWEGMEWIKAKKIFNQAQKEADDCGLALSLPPFHPRAHRECGFIKNNVAFVSWDGNIHPCQNLSHNYICYLNGRRKSVTGVSFGNLMESDFNDIWNSPSYRNFRALTERFDFPPCGDCSFADGCSLINISNFENDCYFQRQPCGDCPWSRGLLQC